jgi:hypothetical protein
LKFRELLNERFPVQGVDPVLLGIVLDLIQIVDARGWHELSRIRIDIIGSLEILLVPLRHFNDFMHGGGEVVALDPELLFLDID